MKPALFVILPRIPYPLEKGDKLRAYYFIKGLSETYDITLFALYREPYEQETIEKIEQICKEYHFYKISLVKVVFRAIGALLSGIPFQVAYFRRRKMQRDIWRIAKEKKPEAVFCQLIRTASYIKGLDCNTVLDLQDTLSLGMKRRAAKSSGLMRRFFAMEGRRLLRYESQAIAWFKHSIIITSQDRNALPGQQQHKVQVIANGVDMMHYRSMPCEKSISMLFVGNMSYAPNIDAMEYFVSEILPSVLSQMPSNELVIAGAHPHSRVKMLASDNVIISGWVDDLREYYCKAKVFIAPMQIGTGLQNKLLEAMSMEIPCITTTLANNALGAVHGRDIIVADTPEEWVSWILRLMNDEALRQRIATNGKIFIEQHYSWKSKIEQLHKILKT